MKLSNQPFPNTENNSRRKQFRRLFSITIIALTISAIFIRLQHIDAVRYHYDNSFSNYQALNITTTHHLPLLGQPSSIGFPHPPLTSYLIAAIFQLGGTPLTAAAVIAFLNGFSPLFVYLTARGITAKSGLSLIAAALVAFNPWLIEYSRMSWPPALIPVLVPLLAWLLYPVLTGSARHPARRTIAALAALTLTVSSFLWAFFLLIPVGLLLIIFRKRATYTGLFIGGLIVAAYLAVFAYAALSTNEISDSSALLTRNPALFKPEALSHAARMVTGASYAEARAGDTIDAQIRQQLGFIAEIALTIPLVVGILSALVALFRDEYGSIRRDAAAVMLTFFLFPIAMMSYTGSQIHPYYMLLTVPAGTLLALWGIERMWHGRARPTLISVGVLLICGLWTYEIQRFARLSLETAGAYGLNNLPISDALRLGDAIAAQPANDRIFSEIYEWIAASTAGESVIVQPDERARAIVAPVDGGLYIALTPEGTAAPLPFGETAAVLMLADNSRITLEALDAAQAESALTHRLDIPTENGLTLLGYTLTAASTTTTLQTFWRVTTADFAANPDAFGAFVHLDRPDGSRIGSVDGAILPGYNWRAGDIQVHIASFDTPDEDYRILIGQYDPFQSTPLIFIRPDGVYTDRIEIPHD